MFPTPLYGHFNYGQDFPISVLLERLKKISDTFLEGVPFSAYLTLQSGNTLYGLDYDKVLTLSEKNKDEIKTLSISVSTADGKVVRVFIRSESVVPHAKGQYVISTGQEEINLDIKAMLTGQKREKAKTKKPSMFPFKKKVQEVEEEETESHPVISGSSLTHRSTTILLTDSFHFDREVTIYPLLALLDELSDRYMDYKSFHAQLETTDGDYHFDIQREELRYMFNRRGHTLLNLYFDITNREGHWIDIALSFHPLSDSPNAEVEICSSGNTLDDISDLIREALSIPAPTLPELLHEKISFPVSSFSIEAFIHLFNHVSHQYLFRIPPVASLKIKGNKAYTGLSFFQLEKLYKEQISEVTGITVDMTQHLTGQSCNVDVSFDTTQKEASLALTIELGNLEIQEEISALVKGQFQGKKSTQDS